MKKRMTAMLMVALTIMLIAAGCGKAGHEPIAVDESVDKCAICNMAVRDDAYAVQLTTKEGKTFKFDDIGCMNDWKSKNADAAISAEYVRDYNDKAWVAYNDAYYVYDADFKSPMAYGVYSFKDKKAAESFVGEQGKGKLMTAQELGSHNWAQNKEQMNMGGSDHEEGMDMGTNEGAEMDMGANEGSGMDMSGNTSTNSGSH
ncbi:copper chaperone NosL [Paenibacillaceae bacterium GAS479]|nr:copper chaperone NosL [Paenibacillaceae bacterium GAS479]